MKKTNDEMANGEVWLYRDQALRLVRSYYQVSDGKFDECAKERIFRTSNAGGSIKLYSMTSLIEWAKARAKEARLEEIADKMKRRERRAQNRWHEKSKEERARLSRGGKCVNVRGGVRKWCENCGKTFVGVTEERRLCENCWEAKCKGGGYPRRVIVPITNSQQYSSPYYQTGPWASDTCGCGGEIVVHRLIVSNKQRHWKNANGNVPIHTFGYYAQCVGDCRTITEYYPSAEDAVAACRARVGI